MAKMRAVQVAKARGELEMVEREIPEPGPGKVRVKVEACGICGSDVHGYDGSSGRRIPPIVMGHEAAGTIAAIGKDVRSFFEGDRVTFDSTIYCGSCTNCDRGDVNLCDKRHARAAQGSLTLRRRHPWLKDVS